MGDWEYRVLWEFAGLAPPNLHEDELESIIRTLDEVATAVGSGMHDVHATLSNLSSSISSEAFNALHGRWEAKGRKALFNLWNTLMDLQIAFGRVLTEIYEWKAKLVVAVGLADMGLTFAYVASGGAAALASHVEGHVVRSEVARRLQHLLDELEAKIVTVAIQGTPLHAAEDLIARELQALLDAAITDSAHTAGSKAGG